MNRISILLSLLLISVTVCSCGVNRYVPVENSQKDSVIIHMKDSVIFRDSIIFVQVPKESTSAIVASSDSSHLDTEVATSDAWIKEGKLHHTLRNKEKLQPIEVKIPIKIHSVQENRHQLAARTMIKEVEKELTWWQRLWITSGKVAWGIGFMIVLLFILRVVRSLKVV